MESKVCEYHWRFLVIIPRANTPLINKTNERLHGSTCYRDMLINIKDYDAFMNFVYRFSLAILHRQICKMLPFCVSTTLKLYYYASLSLVPPISPFSWAHLVPGETRRIYCCGQSSSPQPHFACWIHITAALRLRYNEDERVRCMYT